LSERLDLTIRFKRKPVYYEEAENSMIDFPNRGPRVINHKLFHGIYRTLTEKIKNPGDGY